MPVKRRNTLRRRNSKKRNPSKKKPLRKRSTKKNSLKRKKNLSGGGRPAIYSVPTPEYPDYVVPEYPNYGTPAPLPPPPNTGYDFPAPPTFKQEKDRLSGAASAMTVEDGDYGPQLVYGPREEAIAQTYAGEGQFQSPPPPPPPSPPEVPKETYDKDGNLVRYPGEDFFHYLSRVLFDKAVRSGPKCPELTDDMDPLEKRDAEYCYKRDEMRKNRPNKHL